MASENLRKLAAEIRKLATTEENRRMVKVGQALQAARALSLLREKVKNHA